MEAQSFGVPLGYGGPYAASSRRKRSSFARCPAASSARPRTSNGKRGFVLTLSTREQHIRREKATSNICTNQALIALMANIFMTVYGREGISELAQAEPGEGRVRRRAVRRRRRKVLFDGAPRFNEFVVADQGRSRTINDRLLDRKNIIGGFPLKKFYPELGNAAVWCCTETDHARRPIDAAAAGGERNGVRTTKIQQGHHPHQPERRPHLREVLARQEGLQVCRRSTCLKSTRRRLLGELQRDEDLGNMPEVSEIEIIRHFTRISTWNYAVDHGMYPLGSCTMKYNARVNEVRRAPGRPRRTRIRISPKRISQGALRIMKMLARAAHRDHRHGCHHAAARRRRAWRAHRHSARPRLPRVARAIRARRF